MRRFVEGIVGVAFVVSSSVLATAAWYEKGPGKPELAREFRLERRERVEAFGDVYDVRYYTHEKGGCLGIAITQNSVSMAGLPEEWCKEPTQTG